MFFIESRLALILKIEMSFIGPELDLRAHKRTVTDIQVGESKRMNFAAGPGLESFGGKMT